jgi:hypothetical protein
MQVHGRTLRQCSPRLSEWMPSRLVAARRRRQGRSPASPRTRATSGPNPGPAGRSMSTRTQTSALPSSSSEDPRLSAPSTTGCSSCDHPSWAGRPRAGKDQPGGGQTAHRGGWKHRAQSRRHIAPMTTPSRSATKRAGWHQNSSSAWPRRAATRLPKACITAAPRAFSSNSPITQCDAVCALVGIRPHAAATCTQVADGPGLH